jgi:hypothetical protein
VAGFRHLLAVIRLLLIGPAVHRNLRLEVRGRQVHSAWERLQHTSTRTLRNQTYPRRTLYCSPETGISWKSKKLRNGLLSFDTRWTAYKTMWLTILRFRFRLFCNRGESGSLSWCWVPIWGQWPDFYCCRTFEGFSFCGALLDERMDL